MVLGALFAFAASAGLAFAAPFPQGEAISTSVNINNIPASDATVDSCPGYTASNVITTDSTLTADLTLAGTACNVYSDDIPNLKLVVEYQTRKSTARQCSLQTQTETTKMTGCTSRSTTQLFRSSRSRRRSCHDQRTKTQPHPMQHYSLTWSGRHFPSR